MFTWLTAFKETEKEKLMYLAKVLQERAEPGYQEVQTRSIWTDFAKDHSLPFHCMMEGKAPVITLGDYQHARFKVVFTADLDAVWNPISKSWMHLCGHHVQSIHAFALALLYQQGFFSPTVAIRLIGCPAEECYPAFFPTNASRFIPGKQILYDQGAFVGASCVLSTHLADDISKRAVVFARGAYGLVWLRLRHCAPNEGAMHTDMIAHIKDFLHSCFVDMSLVDYDVYIRTKVVHDGCIRPSGDELVAFLYKMDVDAFLVTEYPPLLQDKNLVKTSRRLLHDKYPEVTSLDSILLQGATDFGVASDEIPTLQLFVGGTQHITHDPDFTVLDEEFAYLFAGVFLSNLIQLLARDELVMKGRRT